MTNTEIEEIRDRQKTTVNPQDTKLTEREIWQLETKWAKRNDS